MNAIDTNVLVYLVDADEPTKQQRTDELVDSLSGETVPTLLLWQVAGEFLSCMRRWERVAKISRSQTETYLKQILATFALELPSEEVLLGALDLTDRYSLSHWDSMLIAACISAGVTTLYSEDMGDGSVYDGVRVVDPFASSG